MPTYDSVVQAIIPRVEFHQNRYARGLGDAARPGCRWLDLGAGTKMHGGWIGPSESNLAGLAGMYVGCDLVIDHLRANQRLDYAVGAEGDHLPFRDGSFDIVTANMVVEHLEYPEHVFAEVARVLCPGGRFVFVTPNRNNPVVRLASILLSAPARKAMARAMEGRASEHIFYTFYRANTVAAIRRLTESLPLRPKVLEPFNSYPFAREPWPVTALEAMWIRTIQRPYFRVLGSNLFGDLERVG